MGVNKTYFFPVMKTAKKCDDYIESFGVLDFETYKDDKGNHRVYAGGFKAEGEKPIMVTRTDKAPFVKNVVPVLVQKMFEQVATLQPKVIRGPKKGTPRKFTYHVFAHNLARFDGHFMREPIEKVTLEPRFKNETTIRNIARQHKDFPDLKIVRRDSNRICPGKLEKLALTFGCKTLKGIFPYEFVTKDTIFYEGRKPIKERYPQITDEEYMRIPREG